MSEIVKFYANRSVLITGCTGFLGQVLAEKLIRSLPSLKSVFLLIRPHKGVEPQDRLSKLLSSPVRLYYAGHCFLKTLKQLITLIREKQTLKYQFDDLIVPLVNNRITVSAV